jgi:hypothetical protein
MTPDQISGSNIVANGPDDLQGILENAAKYRDILNNPMMAIIERLDKIVLLLEMQTLVPDEVPVCEHRNAVDHGVMGDRAGEHMFCPECKETFSLIAEE